MAAGFKRVENKRPRRNNFNLSHTIKFMADMFKMYPILVQRANPGDVWKLNNQILARANPLLKPFMHDVNITVHYWFCSLRAMHEAQMKFLSKLNGIGREQDSSIMLDLEQWMSGGDDPDNYTKPYLRIGATNPNQPSPRTSNIARPNDGVTTLFQMLYGSQQGGTAIVPNVDPLWAYHWTWWENYRDENQFNLNGLKGTARPGWNLSGTQNVAPGLAAIMAQDFHTRAWEKDYFTSLLPWQQKGTSPALPIYGFGTTEFLGGTQQQNPVPSPLGYDQGNIELSAQQPNIATQFRDLWLSQNIMNTASMTSINVNDLRLVVQTQRWLERNARGGTRYTQLLKNHHGRAPRDETLNRPVYIGGSRQPLIISEIAQTSNGANDNAPMGNLCGHGISASETSCGSYSVNEYGIILGIMSIMPALEYEAQGLSKQWDWTSRFDAYWHEFVNLSEQAVRGYELVNSTDGIATQLDRILGFMGRYDEFRWIPSRVFGEFRTTTHRPWHLARMFPNNVELNLDLFRASNAEQDFMKRAFAIPNEPAFEITFVNDLPSITRALPWIATPGRLDHG